MKVKIFNNLITLAENLSSPLYAVGGIVRNFLLSGEPSTDVDLAGAIPTEELAEIAISLGFKVIATYKRTGTLVFGKAGERFEYTRFRKETYSTGGEHTPTEVVWTDQIEEDAKRRDFKCNAVYYDIKNARIVDPLNGREDIKKGILDTVVSPSEVFSHDGLRLMRLARFRGELNFLPTDEVVRSAKDGADNIKDISPERIFDELKRILIADTKYSFSDKRGHYNGLKLLDEIGVLDRILPELTEGRNMVQRADFHSYDVLEHSLRTVLYAKPEVRLPALLHDIGKPYAMKRSGRYHSHNVDGAPIATAVLDRLKADNKTKERVKFLVLEHMKDLKGEMKENKIRRYIVENYPLLDDWFSLKQADYSAGKDDLGECPTVTKWKEILGRMKEEGAPFDYKGLQISANDLIGLGFEGERIGRTLKNLLFHTAINPQDNKREKLLRLAQKDNKF